MKAEPKVEPKPEAKAEEKPVAVGKVNTSIFEQNIKANQDAKSMPPPGKPVVKPALVKSEPVAE